MLTTQMVFAYYIRTLTWLLSHVPASELPALMDRIERLLDEYGRRFPAMPCAPSDLVTVD